MSQRYEILKDQMNTFLVSVGAKTGSELRGLIAAFNGAIPDTPGLELLSATELEQLARNIEENNDVDMGGGAFVDSDDFEEWLPSAKKDIDPFYWSRYKQHLIREGLPTDVVIGLDTITDRILGRLENPSRNNNWDRRGMVVGHVQSGKTANYTGLVCKAADAGYKLIIVIAGIHNNLRNQTQARIDEGFIGRDTGRMGKGGKGSRTIGVGKIRDGNVPVSLTTTISDFPKKIATTNKSQIDSYKVPVVLVIKKNSSTLANVIGWLKDNSAHHVSETINQPMLVIDDEADNASINTKYGKEEVTRINGQIRELLKLFHRSAYVGYTATPFANIFIDPEDSNEMLGEDLFPRDFIVGLDAPSNYFGGKKVFIDGIPEPEDGDPEFVRFIDDNEDVYPMVHTKDFVVGDLPPSLHVALRAFLITRTIRNLRGQADKHSSMLVNASRFTDVQGHLRNRLHEALDALLDALRVNGARGKAALSDPEIAALHETWLAEFENAGFSWDEVLGAMYDAVASAHVVEVNSKKNDLDYSASKGEGKTVIAVGGFSLSRGLTLEGLTTTWFLRNTMMYDTLMQMGRWFGYRPKYEDLCRIWMPREAVSWYAHIAEASEELHEELRRMENAKSTPLQFGLAVKSHPSSLMVTARNKLGTGTETRYQVGLSGKFIETPHLDPRPDAIEKNRTAAKSFLGGLVQTGFGMGKAQRISDGYLLQRVHVTLIDRFLSGWVNAERNLLTQIDPLRKYIDDRKLTELGEWDVLIGSKVKGDVEEISGWPIIPMERTIGAKQFEQGTISIGGNNARVSSPAIEKTGVPDELALAAEARYRALPENKRAEGKKLNYPGHIYRSQRVRPLFVLYTVAIRAPENSDIAERDNFPKKPVVAWAISFPHSATPGDTVDYIINSRKQKEIFGDGDDADEDETIND